MVEEIDPIEIEIFGKIVCVFGHPDTGKTNFLRWLLSLPQYRRHCIFDPVKDYPTGDYTVYRPDSRYHSSEGGQADKELNELVDKLINDVGKSLRPRVVVVDEANRPLAHGQPLPPAVRDIIDFNTHYDPPITFVTACRRPAGQMNAEVIELATEFFILSAGGKNDRSHYANIHVDLPDALEAKGEFEVAYAKKGGKCGIFSPVKDMGEKGRI